MHFFLQAYSCARYFIKVKSLVAIWIQHSQKSCPWNLIYYTTFELFLSEITIFSFLGCLLLIIIAWINRGHFLINEWKFHWILLFRTFWQKNVFSRKFSQKRGFFFGQLYHFQPFSNLQVSIPFCQSFSLAHQQILVNHVFSTILAWGLHNYWNQPKNSHGPLGTWGSCISQIKSLRNDANFFGFFG